MKETKAQRIYRATRYECGKHIEHWGVERNSNGKMVGFNRMATEEVAYPRTLTEIEKELNRERYNIEASVRYGIRTTEEAEKRLLVLEMVQSTIDNAREGWKNF